MCGAATTSGANLCISGADLSNRNCYRPHRPAMGTTLGCVLGPLYTGALFELHMRVFLITLHAFLLTGPGVRVFFGFAGVSGTPSFFIGRLFCLGCTLGGTPLDEH